MIVVALAVVMLAGAVVAHRFWPRPTAPSLLDERVRELVVVTLKTGEAFRGVLTEFDDKVWVLRNTEALTADKRPISVDGELVILTSNVAYANKP